MFLCTYIFMCIWVYTGEVNSKRIRERYLQAVLRQDIAYFDNVGAGEVATRIQTDTRKPSCYCSPTLTRLCDTDLVQQGMSEKVALVINFIGAFVTGFILAYVRCWRLALAMSSILPCIGIAGTIINKLASGYMQCVFLRVELNSIQMDLNHRLALKHVADGGTLAEEVISTVRTAHAFGTQKTLSGLYDAHVTAASVVDAKGALVNGGGLGFFYFIMYAAYALGAENSTFFYLVAESVSSFRIWYNLDQRGSW
jgi:ATP-binding cassette subfamily B (MDR/TAP) protein 1